MVFESVLLKSELLERDVKIDMYLPTSVHDPSEMSLLLINDGQDLPKMPFIEMLEELYEQQKITPLFCVGIHCGADRKMEYGIASQADYLGRGAKAGAYTSFP